MNKQQYPPYTVAVPMRFRDLDAYGHVNNATMFAYLEEARIALLGRRFYQADPARDIQFLVKRAACEYIRPLLLTGSEIQVTMYITEMRGASFLLNYLIHDTVGTHYAEAETMMVCFDPVRQRPARVPTWFTDFLQQLR